MRQMGVEETIHLEGNEADQDEGAHNNPYTDDITGVEVG